MSSTASAISKALFLVLALVAPCGASTYAKVDAYALAAPASAERTVSSLAAYLQLHCHNDREKAHAAYRWVADRIRYDVNALHNGTPLDGSADATLHRRIALCEGYARLYEALLQQMGVPCERINGYLKGFGGMPTAYHAWVAVNLGGRWGLVDPTLGSGYADGDTGLYRKRFDEHFFLTPPQQFIWDHFPDQERWQLLSRPWTHSQFDDHVAVGANFFEYHVSPATPAAEHSVLSCGSTMTLTLSAPAQTASGARFEMMGRLQGDAGSLEDCVLVTRSGDRYRFDVHFPRPENYRLVVFGGPEGSGRLKSMVEYSLRCAHGMQPFHPFPECFGKFVTLGASLEGPESGVLSAGASQSFRVTVPGADELLVDNAGARYQLRRRGQTFEGNLRLRPGKLTLYEGQTGQVLKHAILGYRVR